MLVGEAIEILRKHNEWRRDRVSEVPMPMTNPTLLGKAIDSIINNFDETQWQDYEKGEWPEYYRPVLCYQEGLPKLCWMASNGDDNFFTICGTDIIVNYVRYWRYIEYEPVKTEKEGVAENLKE